MEFFATVATEKVPIFGGDSGFWIEVKKELSAGDSKRLALAALKGVRKSASDDEGSQAFDLDLEVAAFNKVALYLVDWNVSDANGKSVEIDTPKKKLDALKNLKPSVLAEIEKAIDLFLAGQEKKAPPSSNG